MCDLSGSQLIAWMDGELEDADARTVAAHVQACTQCKRRVRQTRALSREIGEYSRAAVGGGQRQNWWWMAGAAAAIALLAAGLAWMRQQPADVRPVARIAVPKPQPAPRVEVAAVKVAPQPRPKTVRRATRPAPAPVRFQEDPGVLVAIPVDEMLPVGAAPPGALLVGHMSFNAAGLPASFRVQKTGFEQ